MLFFAGHSQTEGQKESQTGRIYINDRLQHNSLTIEQFEAAIAGAVSNGLKLAIFNSCDGLGLATALSDLHIPQVIVMREPVANRVAQAFFKYFLEAFAKQHLSLYLAVRQARRQLQGLEDEFPGASWLPVLSQNPAVEPPTWREWSRGSDGGMGSRLRHASQGGDGERKEKGTILRILLASLVTTVCVMGVRWLGLLQPWELQGKDYLATPYGQRILGVFIQAQMVSQLIQCSQRRACPRSRFGPGKLKFFGSGSGQSSVA